jgi:hypothetical protein
MQAKFFKLSTVFLTAVLIVLASFSGTNVQAGPLPQETEEADVHCPPGYTVVGAEVEMPEHEEGEMEVGGPCALVAILAGANEVPGPGDEDGAGAAFVTVDAEKGEICYAILISGIELPATGAHIHVGTAEEAGDVVVPFTAPDENGAAEGCVTPEDPAIVTSILENPAGYYVNIHSSDLPKGAIRGQLSGATALNGGQEIPGPGDEDGWGFAYLSLDEEKNEVCYLLWVADVELPATGAHIHKAARGEAGDVVIPFTAPDETGVASGCATPNEGVTITDLIESPELYYVNIHTSDFKAGAIRGQMQ